jgi:hypothetical protein
MKRLLTLPIMKYLLFPLLLCLFACTPEPDNNPDFTADDVLNYWTAYDLVTATTDSAAQANILEREFFAKGTPGLAAIMQARRYTKEEYRQNINNYPKFWASMRENMLRAPELVSQVAAGGEGLFKLYPQQHPGKVYFTVGCFRTNGTVMDSLVLFGSEMCMAGPDVDLSEWPEEMNWAKPYMSSNPIKGLKFLATHEFGHTQQPTRSGYNNLSQCVFEGIPEFMATLALNLPSDTPAIIYGKENDEAIKAAFAKEMNSPFSSDWLYNNTDNQFNTRDLGYHIGLSIAKKYYEAAGDKKAAIKTLIELDYADRPTLEAFVDETGYFDRPVAEYNAEFEARRPTVIAIQEFESGAINVSPKLTEITLEFSEPLNLNYRSHGLGPLGKDNVLRIQDVAVAEDGKAITLKVELEPKKQYQIILEEGYRTDDGMPLVPYLLEFTTR